MYHLLISSNKTLKPGRALPREFLRFEVAICCLLCFLELLSMKQGYRKLPPK